jgi:hypothetical protein
MTHDLNVRRPAAIDSCVQDHQDHLRVRVTVGVTTATEEVQCPRVTLAAMIAAAAFGPRRSGGLGER